MMSIDMMMAALREERDDDQRRRDAALEVHLSSPKVRARLHEFDQECQALAERM